MHMSDNRHVPVAVGVSLVAESKVCQPLQKFVIAGIFSSNIE